MKEKKDDKDITEEEAEKLANEITDKIFKVDQGTQTIMEALVPLWLNAGELGNEFFNQIHFTDPNNGTVFSIIKDDYVEWLNAYGGDQIVRINETTKLITRDIIKDGLLNGNSINTIAENLIDNIMEYSKTRAVTIAETEIHNTFMHSNNLTAKKSGFKYKRWLSSRDAAVRPNHQKYDALGAIPIDKDFTPGLSYPGDSGAPAAEVVKCRCVIRYMMKKED